MTTIFDVKAAVKRDERIRRASLLTKLIRRPELGALVGLDPHHPLLRVRRQRLHVHPGRAS